MATKKAIGDNLLIRQTALTPETPWGYRISRLQADDTIVEASGITTENVILAISIATFASYEGQTLLLEVLDSGGDVIEDDCLTITGAYRRLPEVQGLVGLLGENRVDSSALSADFQDGHAVHKTVTLYQEAALTTVLETHDWIQTFITDFTPDHRYQRQTIRQRQES